MNAIVELKFPGMDFPFPEIGEEQDFVDIFLDGNLYDSELLNVTHYDGDIDRECNYIEQGANSNVIVHFIMELPQYLVSDFKTNKLSVIREIDAARSMLPMEIIGDWKCGRDHYILISLDEENQPYDH